MSKSLGNGIDPLEVIDQYGADALRFMLTTGITPGNDMRFSEDKIEAARNFANKLWNASRFTIMNLQDEEGAFLPMAAEDTDRLQDEDKWILSAVNDTIRETTAYMERFDLAMAASKVYDLIWNQFCDWYIEIVKDRLHGEDEDDRQVVRMVLVRVLKDMLRLLHPFMPFITEEIWSCLPGDTCEEAASGFLMKASWPVYRAEDEHPEEAQRLETAKEVIRAIRGLRLEAEAAPSKELSAWILADEESQEAIRAGERYIRKLANINALHFTARKEELPEDTMSAILPGAEIFVPMDELVDIAAELERTRKEKERLVGEVKRSEKMLSNPGFVNKAPAAKVEEERAKKVSYEEMLAKVNERLAMLEKKA